MTEVKIKGKTMSISNRIFFEFGAAQVDMDISAKGTYAEKLKLKEGDRVEVTIKKL